MTVSPASSQTQETELPLVPAANPVRSRSNQFVQSLSWRLCSLFSVVTLKQSIREEQEMLGLSVKLQQLRKKRFQFKNANDCDTEPKPHSPQLSFCRSRGPKSCSQAVRTRATTLIIVFISLAHFIQ